jgi:hypothetical protein
MSAYGPQAAIRPTIKFMNPNLLDQWPVVTELLSYRMSVWNR